MPLVYLEDGYLFGLLVWLALLPTGLVLLLKMRRRFRAQPRRVAVVHGLLSLWLLCLVLTGGELYFALVYDETDSFNMTKVSQKWFRKHIEPQQQALTFANGQGIVYRDDQPFRRPTAEEHHVCFIGDSFTFGHGIPSVADRFSNRVRSILDKDQPNKYLVSNLARAGVDLHWVEVALQQLFSADYRIDTVVYVICLNDIETFHPQHAEFYTRLGAQGPQFFLFRESYLLNLLYFRLRQFTVPAVRDYYGFLADYYRGPPWDRMQAKLDAVRSLCQDHNSELRIVVFPFLHNLGPDYQFLEAHRKIIEYGRKREVPVLDLEPVLSPHVAEGLRVNRFDAHPNERAHALAAQAIVKDLIPAPSPPPGP